MSRFLAPLLFTMSLLPESTRAAVVSYTNLAAFQAAAGDLTLVGFDDLPAGSNLPLTNHYASLGLTIVQRDGRPINLVTPPNLTFISFANLASAPNGISSSAGSGVFFADEYSDSFDFIFGHPVFAAGLWIGNINPGETIVQFFSTSNSALATMVFWGDESDLIGSCQQCRIFYGIVSTVPIGRIRTSEYWYDGDGIVYDDVYFTAAVPEPASCSLLGAGALALAAARWRRRSAKAAVDPTAARAGGPPPRGESSASARA